MTCRTCRWSYTAKPTGELTCGIELPTKLAAALGVSSPYTIPDVKTHPEWFCSFDEYDKEKE